MTEAIERYRPSATWGHVDLGSGLQAMDRLKSVASCVCQCIVGVTSLPTGPDDIIWHYAPRIRKHGRVLRSDITPTKRCVTSRHMAPCGMNGQRYRCPIPEVEPTKQTLF